MTLDNTGKIEIGLKLFSSLTGPALCKGLTFVSFHLSGNVLVLMLKLQIYVRLSEQQEGLPFSEV